MPFGWHNRGRTCRGRSSAVGVRAIDVSIAGARRPGSFLRRPPGGHTLGAKDSDIVNTAALAVFKGTAEMVPESGSATHEAPRAAGRLLFEIE